MSSKCLFKILTSHMNIAFSSIIRMTIFNIKTFILAKHPYKIDAPENIDHVILWLNVLPGKMQDTARGM